jgi:hypothetical protein
MIYSLAYSVLIVAAMFCIIGSHLEGADSAATGNLVSFTRMIYRWQFSKNRRSTDGKG